MKKKDVKKVLWENIERLMRHHYGKKNITKLASESEVGNGTIQRIEEQNTSVGVDNLEKIADALKVEIWQLLVPGIDPANLPSIGDSGGGWDLPMVNKNRYESLPLENRVFVQGYLQRVIEEQEAAVQHKANGSTNS
ncbi:helix-turn-helix transcriptional regulator [Rhodoferax sp. GW822-FHT02A01]|uniref:helix-turn-helix domain-containing protein n=1 Tax=Rhodoferax sp. GW822-FHT02A01 TaxID=3141537 RepID=UPI00315D2789